MSEHTDGIRAPRLTERNREQIREIERRAEAFLREQEEYEARLAGISDLIASKITPIGEQFREIAETQTRAMISALAAGTDRVVGGLEQRPKRRSRRAEKSATPVLPVDCARLVSELERLTEERIEVPTDGRDPAATRYWLQRRLAEEKAHRDGKRLGVLGLYLVALDRIEPEIRGAMPEPEADRERSPTAWGAEAKRCADSWARIGRRAAERTSSRTKTTAGAAR